MGYFGVRAIKAERAFEALNLIHGHRCKRMGFTAIDPAEQDARIGSHAQPPPFVVDGELRGSGFCGGKACGTCRKNRDGAPPRRMFKAQRFLLVTAQERFLLPALSPAASSVLLVF